MKNASSGPKVEIKYRVAAINTSFFKILIYSAITWHVYLPFFFCELSPDDGSLNRIV